MNRLPPSCSRIVFATTRFVFVSMTFSFRRAAGLSTHLFDTYRIGKLAEVNDKIVCDARFLRNQ